MITQRESYRLDPLSNPTKFKYGVYDFEAENWWDMVHVGFYDGQKYYCFTAISDLINHLLKPKYRGWRIFAHNGGRYDTNFIFDWLIENRPDGIDYKFYCSGSRVVSFTLYQGRNWVRLCDSYQLLPAAQAKLCEAFDVAHKKTELDIQSVEYNRNDCLGLYEILTRFFDETNMMAETFASHALKVWRYNYQKKSLFKPSRSVEDVARRSYCAGRVEIFKHRGTVACYDVNSMFPWAMMRPVPTRYLGQTRNLEPRTGCVAFLEADIEYPDSYIPALPYRHGKLLFPVGRFRGVWYHGELQAAITDGASVRIRSGYLFEAESIFAPYVTKLYAIKRNRGEPWRTIAKFLLNSLYGKFGQSREKRLYALWKGQVGYAPLYDPDGEETGLCYRPVECGSGHLLPHISSVITARSRIRLWEALRKWHPYYCDTDCIFTEDQMPTGDGLGEWSRESGPDEAEFFQPKLYRHGETWRSKGLSKAAPRELSAYVRGEPITFSRHRSVKESSRDGKPACKMIDVTKHMVDNFPKRPRTEINDTRPWRIIGGELR